jgi:uncharacterized protein (DUF305 family)
MTYGDRRPLLALLAAAALALSACGGDPAAAPAATASAPPPSSPPSATAGTTEDAAHNQADVMFSMMMIPHHAQAVEMSELVLASDDLPPEVTDLAQRIRDAQEPEIEQMSGWLEEWGYPAGMGEGMGEMADGLGDVARGGMGNQDIGGMGSMSGMLSAEDMQALADATGPDAARLFLEGMIEHHLGAIEMAEREVEQGRHPGTVALAGQIIRAQQAEITEMRALLAGG